MSKSLSKHSNVEEEVFSSWDPRDLDRQVLGPFPPQPSEQVSRMTRIREELTIIKAWLKEHQNQSIITYFSHSEEDIAKDWLLTLKGPPGTPYEGGEYKMMVSFPKDFPSRSKPIHLQFATPPPYACNVLQTKSTYDDTPCGTVCGWYEMRHIQLSAVDIVEDVAHTVFCRGTVHTLSRTFHRTPVLIHHIEYS